MRSTARRISSRSGRPTIAAASASCSPRELGYLNADRSVTGVNAFGDGVTGGDVDGEPFDTRVDLDGIIQTWSLFATDTLSLGEAWHLTVSARYNRTTIDNRDRIEPGGGPGSLDGDHVFDRLNPAAGVTFSPSKSVNVYVGYSEGSRAPTSIELGCADPEEPCKLPNAMAGDPPLSQVVTRTLEAGVRGQRRTASAGTPACSAPQNTEDILFVMSDQTGFGYFKNFGETRRQGVEIGHERADRTRRLGTGYTFLSATYQSEETVNGESNSSNDAAEAGEPGLEGSIEIEPGDRIPLIPQHMVKAFADIEIALERHREPERRGRLGVDRARQREQPARARRHVLSRPGRRRRLRAGEPRRPVSGQTVARLRRADQQSVRPAILDGGAARAERVHGHGRLHRPTASGRERRVPRPADHVLRPGRAHQGMVRHPDQVLNQSRLRITTSSA